MRSKVACNKGKINGFGYEINEAHGGVGYSYSVIHHFETGGFQLVGLGTKETYNGAIDAVTNIIDRGSNVDGN